MRKKVDIPDLQEKVTKNQKQQISHITVTVLCQPIFVWFSK